MENKPSVQQTVSKPLTLQHLTEILKEYNSSTTESFLAKLHGKV
jgi:hypothetical protein